MEGFYFFGIKLLRKVHCFLFEIKSPHLHQFENFKEISRNAKCQAFCKKKV